MLLLTQIATLCVKELRVLMRDRQAAALLFGMPAVFILLLSLALEDIYGEKVGTRLEVVVEDEDGGALARQALAKLAEGGELELVPRPAGTENAALFREGDVRAAVRIPAGFSADASAFLANAGVNDFGPNRIEWETSPTLDASTRWFLEAQLAIVWMRLVQDELIAGQRDLGEDLEEMGAVLEQTFTALEETAGELQDTAGQLDGIAQALEGSPEELEALATAALIEAAATREARNARTFLRSQGIWDDGGLVGSVRLAEAALVIREPLFPPPEPAADEAVGAELRELGERARSLVEKHAPQEIPKEPEEAGGGSVQRLEESAPSQEIVAPARGGRVAAGDELATAEQETERAAPADEPADRAEPAGTSAFLRDTSRERDELPTPLQQTVPGWSLFAMFFLVVPLSTAIHRERADGTLHRTLAVAVPRGAVVLGKLLPYVLVGALQFAGMLAVGLYLLPLVSDLSLDLGERPGVLVPITLVCSLAATSYSLLVATFTRTAEQASAFGAISIIILALLGGVMVPHFVMPAFLQEAAVVSPIYWGHRAYLDAFLHGAGLAEVALPLQVLGGFAVLCLLLATFRLVRA